MKGEIVKLLVNLFFLSLVGTAWASGAKHFELAKEFEKYSSSGNKAQMIDSLLPMLASVDPVYKEYSEELREFLVGIYTSQEYFETKARFYMTIYTEEELEVLVELVKSPGYQILQSKRNEINIGLWQIGQEAVLSKLPEFKELIGDNL